MLKIKRGEINIIYPTFSELKLDQSAWVVVLLINETTKGHLVFTLKNNISEQVGRFDTYYIEDTLDPSEADADAAKISLPLSGFYIYKAYEWADVFSEPIAATPLAVFDDLKPLEIGRLLATGDDPTLDEVYK